MYSKIGLNCIISPILRKPYIALFHFPGFYSWRNPEDGTWFIQCLCQELQKHAENMELQKILTRVQRRVALDHESYNDMIPWQHEQKQVCQIVFISKSFLYCVILFSCFRFPLWYPC